VTENTASRLNLDPRDIQRSPVAQAIGTWAEQENLFCYHYEYRYQLEPPGHWYLQQPAVGVAKWQAGILQENTYQAFRNDSVLASFHPGQSSKWGTHELLHKLVGFCWQPGQDLFFHTIANWLAEVLPVTQYYFYDEIRSAKCSRHKDYAFLPSSYCHECEKVAAISEASPRDEKFKELGLQFFALQINAIKDSICRRSISLAPYMNLDLAKDAQNYAKYNLYRLNSQDFQDYMQYYPDNSQWTPTLEAFIEKVEMIHLALSEGKRPRLYQQKREDWVALDLLYRLTELGALCDESMSNSIDDMKALATNKSWDALVDLYNELEKEFVLPKSHDFFALGYQWHDSYGKSYRLLEQGVRSLAPHHLHKVDLLDFLQQDDGCRDFLADRLQQLSVDAALDFEIELNKSISTYPQHYYGQGDNLALHPSMKFHAINLADLRSLPIEVDKSLAPKEIAFFITFCEDGEKQVYQMSENDFNEMREFATEGKQISADKLDQYLQWHWIVRN